MHFRFGGFLLRLDLLNGRLGLLLLHLGLATTGKHYASLATKGFLDSSFANVSYCWVIVLGRRRNDYFGNRLLVPDSL